MRKPFYRKQNKKWYVWHEGKQLCLGADEKRAYAQWHSLLDAAKVNAPDAPVATVVESFLIAIEGNVSQATQDWYGAYLGSLCKAIGTLPITAIRPLDILKWVKDHGYTDGAKTAALRSAKRLFNWAAEQGIIQATPLRSIKLESGGRREVLISPEDHKRILKALPRRPMEFVIALAESGCRPGEVARVTGADFRQDIGAWYLSKHKTAKATGKPRVVYLSPKLLALTKKLAKEHPEGPLFRNQRGKKWTVGGVRCLFRRLRKSLELPAGTVAYSYRHTFATNALLAGVEAATVAELMGTSVAMIEKHYGHLSKKGDHLRKSLRKVVFN